MRVLWVTLHDVTWSLLFGEADSHVERNQIIRSGYIMGANWPKNDWMICARLQCRLLLLLAPYLFYLCCISCIFNKDILLCHNFKVSSNGKHQQLSRQLHWQLKLGYLIPVSFSFLAENYIKLLFLFSFPAENELSFLVLVSFSAENIKPIFHRFIWWW